MRNEKLGCALQTLEFFTLHSSFFTYSCSLLSIALRSSLSLVLHLLLLFTLRFQYFFQVFLSDRTTGDELSILWQFTIQIDEIVDSGRRCEDNPLEVIEIHKARMLRHHVLVSDEALYAKS